MRTIAILVVLFLTANAVFSQSDFVELQLAGRYTTAVFDEGATEISAYDPETARLFSTNAFTPAIDVIDISDPSAPLYLFSIDVTLYGGGANSVACKDGIVAAAVENNDKTLPGLVVFFDADGTFLNSVEVGALPDMVTFTPDGTMVLCANEGEPDDDYLIDPEGSVSIIDITGGVASLTGADVTTLDFTAFNAAVLDPSIKINGPGSTVAQDLEPEYIAVSRNSKVAWVTLQENNALAIINLATKQVVDVVGLGFKDHSLEGNGLDASNTADDINIRTWPVKGLYMPDAIAYLFAGGNYLVTANEGDARDYDGFSEESRIEDLVLDSVAFPNYADLQNEDSLGRLNITTSLGDIDDDGEFEELYSYGARSFSVWDPMGNLVYDSGDDLEVFLADLYPDHFNASNTNQSFKNRSDDKGPEPEAVTVGNIMGNPYMFLGLERIGGVMIYDMVDPANPVMIDYDNQRDFALDPEDDANGDYGAEGLLFISGADSPNGKNLLISSNEISGSIAIYYTDYQCGRDKVTVCYEGVTYCLPLSIAEALLSLGATAGPCEEMRTAQYLDENDLRYGMSVYPNPASANVNIVLQNLSAGEWNISLFDMTGRMVQRMVAVTSEDMPVQTVGIDVSGLPEGTYICKAFNEKGESFNERLMVIK